MTPTQHFQQMFDDMQPVEELPESAFLGDLCKTKDGTPYVWYGQWRKLVRRSQGFFRNDHFAPFSESRPIL